MAGKLEVNEVPAGLEVGSPPSRGTSNLSARKPVPSYAAPSSMQDGMSQYPQSEDGYRYAPAGEDASRSRRNPCGLSPLIFGLLVALITLIVVGAALGGGLGGSLAAAQKKNASAASSTSSTSIASSTTSSPPTTSSAASATSTTATAVVFSNYEVPRPTSTSDTVALNCPALDQKNYTTARSQNFLMSCNVGLAGYDLVGIAAYIVDDCIEACSSMNAFLASSNNGTSVCTAITFNAAIYDNWNQHANCWLKTKEDVTTSNGVGLLSAQLQGS